MTEGTIHERMIKIASEVGVMEKQQVQNFKAFTVDDVYSKLRPLFQKHGVHIVPQVQSAIYEDRTDDKGRTVIDARIRMAYVMYAPDGTSVCVQFAAEGRDYQDKATNKAVQQAFKYALIQMFMVSTGEVDPDAEGIEVSDQAELSVAEKRMKAIKDHAWQLTTGDDDEAHIAEAVAFVEQSLAVFGGEPRNKGDVETIIANMDEVYADEG